MATKRRRGRAWHYVVKRVGLLGRPVYLSFDSEEEGDRYVEQLELLLDSGVVPEALLRRESALVSVGDAIRGYRRVVAVPASDVGVLGVIEVRQGAVVLSDVGFPWVESWLAELKQVRQLAPSTIRHHVGALARCFDWVVRRHPEALSVHPLRSLPRRYAVYSEVDARAVGGGRVDVSRDRRLLEGEETRVRSVLAGEKPVGRQRPLALLEQAALVLLFELALLEQAALVLLFELALETAMRLRELFTLECGQVDSARRTVFLEKTKNGDKRQVPLSSVAVDRLLAYGVGGTGLLFPWWDGRFERLNAVTSQLSRQFRRVFDAAGCVGLRFHDLRHEATCRFFERTDLSDLQVSKITGHRDLRMLGRYANLRGSDLAARLW